MREKRALCTWRKNKAGARIIECVHLGGHGEEQQMKTCWKGKLKEEWWKFRIPAQSENLVLRGNMVPQKFLRIRDTIRAF